MTNREPDLPIKRQAELLGMSRGSVYYLPRPVSEADLALMRSIDKLHLEHPFMGARMLRRMLLLEAVEKRLKMAVERGFGWSGWEIEGLQWRNS